MTATLGRERSVLPGGRTPIAKAWLGPDRVHETIAVPSISLRPGDVLVEIELATICGSDVHTTRGHRSAPTPLVLGHEQVGRIVDVGADAIDSRGEALRIGQRVVWSLTVGCGSCATCARGIPQKCSTVRKYGHERIETGWELSGGFASHMQVLSGTAIVPVAEWLPAEVLAPASCGTATAAAALDAAAAVVDIAGEVVVVFGAGLIGLTVCAMATDRGARVVVVDPDARRASLALRFGAAEVSDPTVPPEDSGSLDAAIARLGRAPLVAVEASGSPRAVAAAIASVGTGSAVVLVGSVFPSGGVQLDPESIVRRLVTIRGVHNYAPRHLEEAVRYLSEEGRARPFADLVGAVIDLDALDEGIEAAARGEHVRVGVRPAAG